MGWTTPTQLSPFIFFLDPKNNILFEDYIWRMQLFIHIQLQYFIFISIFQLHLHSFSKHTLSKNIVTMFLYVVKHIEYLFLFEGLSIYGIQKQV